MKNLPHQKGISNDFLGSLSIPRAGISRITTMYHVDHTLGYWIGDRGGASIPEAIGEYLSSRNMQYRYRVPSDHHLVVR